MELNKITSRQELHETRGENFVICLVCEKPYRVQSWTHLMRIHGLNHRQYRRMFNIPANFGLACDSFRRKTAIRAKKYLVVPDGLAPALKAMGQKGREPHIDWLRTEAAERRRDFNKTLTEDWYKAHGKKTSLLIKKP